MKDGYASLHNAKDQDDAKRQAIELATKNCEEAAMSKSDRRKATTVDYVNSLSEDS